MVSANDHHMAASSIDHTTEERVIEFKALVAGCDRIEDIAADEQKINMPLQHHFLQPSEEFLMFSVATLVMECPA